MFNAFEKKSPSASKDFIWQWIFPAKSLTIIPETNERKRYHLQRHMQKSPALPCKAFLFVVTWLLML